MLEQSSKVGDACVPKASWGFLFGRGWGVGLKDRFEYTASPTRDLLCYQPCAFQVDPQHVYSQKPDTVAYTHSSL